MTERRQYWDDDLITAVCATGEDGEVDYWMPREQVYRIIAAVEDWCVNAHLRAVYVKRMDDAEATIQRVRELCDAREEEETDNGGYGKAAVVRIDYVRDVLDGGDDE